MRIKFRSNGFCVRVHAFCNNQFSPKKETQKKIVRFSSLECTSHLMRIFAAQNASIIYSSIHFESACHFLWNWNFHKLLFSCPLLLTLFPSPVAPFPCVFTFFSILECVYHQSNCNHCCCTHNKYQFGVESTLFLTQYYVLCVCLYQKHTRQRQTIAIYRAKICIVCISKQIKVIYINVSVSLFGMCFLFSCFSLVWFHVCNVFHALDLTLSPARHQKQQQQ